MFSGGRRVAAFEAFFLKPLTVVFLGGAVVSLVLQDWKGASWWLVGPFLLSLITQALHPKRSRQELAGGTERFLAQTATTPETQQGAWADSRLLCRVALQTVAALWFFFAILGVAHDKNWTWSLSVGLAGSLAFAVFGVVISVFAAALVKTETPE